MAGRSSVRGHRLAEDAAQRFAGLSPRERLAELAALVTEIAERAATGWSLYRDASAVDPEIAADWNELQLLRHRLIARVLGDIPLSAQTEGLSINSAIDTAWAIASPRKLRPPRPPPRLPAPGIP